MQPNAGEGNSHTKEGLTTQQMLSAMSDEEKAELADEIEERTTRTAEAVVARSAARREAKAELTLSRAGQIRRDNPADIVKRAKELNSAGFFEYRDVKYGSKGEVQVKLTATNIAIFLDVMFDGSDVRKPHLNEFVGRIVDHRGEIIDDHYPVTEWVEACRVAGLREMDWKKVRESLKEWALEHRWNDLIDRVNGLMPEWDGVPRMRSYLIDLFEPIRTDLNEDFSQYFWLSLFARVMIPGSLAPIILSLFGVQNCGKSYFSKRINQIITGDEDAECVQLDLGADKTNFLREITGTSVIANVGEMTGFNRGDLNKIKEFVTRTSDKMHYKFEGHIDQKRQWITVMDGNKYEGLQRDETGNRRFYPMFCGELPMEHGQHQWRMDFAKGPFIASPQFEDDVWQLMAEASAWFDANGICAYVTFTNKVSKAVMEFSADEMRRESGTIDDELVSPYIDEALMRCQIHKSDNRGFVRFWVDKKEVEEKIAEVAGKGRDPMAKVSAKQWGMSLQKAMMARGSSGKSKRSAEPIDVQSYPFCGFDSADALREYWRTRLGASSDGETTVAFEPFD